MNASLLRIQQRRQRGYFKLCMLLQTALHDSHERHLFRPKSAQRIIVKFYCVILINAFYSLDDG